MWLFDNWFEREAEDSWYNWDRDIQDQDRRNDYDDHFGDYDTWDDRYDELW